MLRDGAPSSATFKPLVEIWDRLDPASAAVFAKFAGETD
jgi:hypothetical protein